MTTVKPFQYIGSDGTAHVISKMQDNHLVNAFLKLRSEYLSLEELPQDQQKVVSVRIDELTSIGNELLKEITRRGLFNMFIDNPIAIS